MRFCPQCGAEYRAGFEECYDCRVGLVDERPILEEDPEGTVSPDAPFQGDEDPRFDSPPVEIFVAGRLMDAELVRARLEGSGIHAMVWSGGMGAYRMESGLTEITGVPNAFNSHRVMVGENDEEEAREILAEEAPPDYPEWVFEPEEGSPTFLSWLRNRNAVAAFILIVIGIAVVLGNL
jgi:hypothetical protein